MTVGGVAESQRDRGRCALDAARSWNERSASSV